MPHTTCTLASNFALTGNESFPDTNFQVDIDLAPGSWVPGDILYCEWYIDGLLVHGQKGLSLSGQLPCGRHTVAARLLTGSGWTGLHSHTFATCRVLLSTSIQGPSSVREGSSTPYYVLEHYSDSTIRDITEQYTFSASGYGTFDGNIFVADHSEDTEDKNVTIQATKPGSTTLNKNIVVRNIDVSTVDIGRVDFIVVRYSWVPVSGRDLDILAGIEHSDTAYDGDYVGHGNPSPTVPSTAPQPATDAYLWWGSDQTGTQGTEAVLLNMKKFTTDNPGDYVAYDFAGNDFWYRDFFTDGGTNTAEVGLYAIWRGGVTGTGIFTVTVKGYKGGQMQKQGSDFVNVGGTLISSTSHNLQTIRSGSGQREDYYRLGRMVYNRTTRWARLFVYSDPIS